MRWYEPYWVKLKENKVLEFTDLPHKEHARYIKAIRKEFDKDQGLKLELAESGERCRIFTERTPKSLTIYLVVENAE